ncbi:5'-nucleotidase-like [Haliotis rufescens]|uniref:5'-nucleotidase-like n=1 Tax=Haliotis rufescens TaxID=6454 RepID=UPI00201FB327|nr:5'-nucleotidase-like [Haliotis rufescens]
MFILPLLSIILPSVVVSFNLTILHTNDIHARIEQTNKYSGQCSPAHVAEGKCYGGFARLKTKIEEIRSAQPNTLLLDGGDQFSGTLWFYKFMGPGTAAFMNHLGYDAMALGNHEFDKGQSGLIPFLDAANFPVLSTNIRLLNQDSPLRTKFKKSHIFTVGGERIGVIGYSTRETPSISSPGADLVFEDEVSTIQSEVSLLTQQGINKIIAVGHSGFHVDKRIAESVEGVDVVVGGHDNTFLYTGPHPSNEEPEGEYPHVVTQTGGAKVLVVQDYAYGKYLGDLEVTFDPEGVITSWGGNPILLDNNTAQDVSTLTFLEPYIQQIDETAYEIVGKSHVPLQGEKAICRRRECNLGNVITDSMVKQNIKHSDSLYWNNVSIAITNSGGIRSSIPKGDITIGQVATVLPFSNTIDIVELYGRHIKAAFEHSVSYHNTDERSGAFLQVSGLKIEFDISRPVGSRVTRLRALCTRCEVPIYEDVQPGQIYQVIMPSFIADGGDFYDVINDNKVKHHLIGDLDLDVFVEYVKQQTPIVQGEEERMMFVNSYPPCPPTAAGMSLHTVTTALGLPLSLCLFMMSRV